MFTPKTKGGSTCGNTFPVIKKSSTSAGYDNYLMNHKYFKSLAVAIIGFVSFLYLLNPGFGFLN
jgi:hypothetical protein